MPKGANQFSVMGPRIDVRGPAECWEWQRARTRAGYGVYRLRGKLRYAHRAVWELANGCRIPQGFLIRHLCDNPSCCNPDHLALGRDLENHGDRNGRIVDAESIRTLRAKGLTHAEIARTVGCSQPHVSRVLNCTRRKAG